MNVSKYTKYLVAHKELINSHFAGKRTTKISIAFSCFVNKNMEELDKYIHALWIDNYNIVNYQLLIKLVKYIQNNGATQSINRDLYFKV